MDKSNPTNWSAWTLGAAAAATISQPNVDIGYRNMTPPNPPTERARASAGTSDSFHYVDEKLLDAKLDAIKADTRRQVEVAEAKTETQFERLLGEIRILGQSISSLDSRLDQVSSDVATVDTNVKSSKGVIITTLIASALAIAALAYAAVAIFQGGMGATADAFAAGAARPSESQK